MSEEKEAGATSETCIPKQRQSLSCGKEILHSRPLDWHRRDNIRGTQQCTCQHRQSATEVGEGKEEWIGVSWKVKLSLENLNTTYLDCGFAADALAKGRLLMAHHADGVELDNALGQGHQVQNVAKGLKWKGLCGEASSTTQHRWSLSLITGSRCDPPCVGKCHPRPPRSPFCRRWPFPRKS